MHTQRRPANIIHHILLPRAGLLRRIAAFRSNLSEEVDLLPARFPGLTILTGAGETFSL